MVIDGCPPGIKITADRIQKDLDRRRPGQSEVTTPRRESDVVHVQSGILNDLSTGMPITLEIFNHDVDSSQYEETKDKWRPGHADFAFDAKYGLRDHRGSGRASGRETVARVAAGAVAKIVLEQYQVDIYAFTRAIGNIFAETIDRDQIEKNLVRSPDAGAAEKMIALIKRMKEEQNSVGGIVELRINGLPAGLGEPVFNKFDAAMAGAMVGLGAVKGVEIGDGFAAAAAKGSENNDEFILKENKVGTKTNHCGGVLGGITTGEEFILRAAVKPPASIAIKQLTLTTARRPTTIQVQGRHDPTIVPRLVPVVESMAALVSLDFILRQESIKSFRTKLP